MKPTDVRIGDLVKYDGRIFEIHAIDKDYPHLNTEEFGVGVVGWDDIEGVQLTEEILLMVGFKKVKDHSRHFPIEFYHYQNDYCWVYLLDDGVFEIEIITIDERHNLCRAYKYIHELQNLYFALTGEELNTEGVK